MQFPRPGTNGRTVLETINKHHALTIDEGIAIHGLFYKSRQRTEQLYGEYVTQGWLLYFDYKYFISKKSSIELNDGRDFVELRNVAGPRIAIKFTPIQKKDIPSANGPRELYGR